MNKETWNILAAVVLIAILGLLITMTGCDKVPLEVGQVWEDEPYSDPFKAGAPAQYKVLALKDGYVQYERLDERGKGAKGSMKENVFRACGAKPIEMPSEENGPACVPYLVPVPDVEEEDETEIVWLSVVDNEPTDISFCLNNVELLFTWNDGTFDVIYDANNLTGAAEAFCIAIEPYLNAHIREVAEKLNKGTDSVEETARAVLFKDITAITTAEAQPQPQAGHLRWVWDKEKEDEGHLELVLDNSWISLDDLRSEPNEPPQWGNGDPPAEYQEFFGNSNGARLDFVQNQAIDKHGLIIVEIAKRLLMLEGADPNSF